MNTPETDTAVSFLSSFFIYNQFRNEYQNIVIYERVNNRFNSVFFSVSFMVVFEKNKIMSREKLRRRRSDFVPSVNYPEAIAGPHGVRATRSECYSHLQCGKPYNKHQ
ncbi:TPA: hypothetical protein ACIPBE_003498 [Salmonella enterica subsp. enterica serovar Litchfield]